MAKKKVPDFFDETIKKDYPSEDSWDMVYSKLLEKALNIYHEKWKGKIGQDEIDEEFAAINSLEAAEDELDVDLYTDEFDNIIHDILATVSMASSCADGLEESPEQLIELKDFIVVSFLMEIATPFFAIPEQCDAFEYALWQLDAGHSYKNWVIYGVDLTRTYQGLV